MNVINIRFLSTVQKIPRWVKATYFGFSGDVGPSIQEEVDQGNSTANCSMMQRVLSILQQG